ncbi:sensor histidine kinase [Agromyces sp. NPDC058110]|uniref:sensor histidine kinase n=1 Tax=Agromyces sp. NPDC058110 TaxID=3346345 RepID=UPI0036DBCE59
MPPWEAGSGWNGPPWARGRADGGWADAADGMGGGGRRFRASARFRLLAPVVISLLVQVPAAIGIAIVTHAGWGQGLLQVLLAAAGPVALLGARRWPGVTVAVVAAAALADVVLVPVAGPPYIALAFAIVIAVAHGAVAWAVSAVATGWVAAVVLVSVWGEPWHPVRVAFTTLALAACFGIGAFVRTRDERMRHYRAEALQRRRTAEERERVRIARELHDVIGHALSQINVQASVGLHLMDRDAEQARTALANIKQTSKTALEEVRSVLGAIRSDADAPLSPQAELAELPRLVAGVATAEFAATLDDRLGGDAPGRAVQFAAYRIIQEALTNIVRHARATRAIVTVERVGDELRLEVDDDGSGLPAASGEGSGILGMRERAALLGGTVEVAPLPDGRGTRVEAHLPWRATP